MSIELKLSRLLVSQQYSNEINHTSHTFQTSRKHWGNVLRNLLKNFLFANFNTSFYVNQLKHISFHGCSKFKQTILLQQHFLMIVCCLKKTFTVYFCQQIDYSSLSNNCAAQLINFYENSSLHVLIPVCTIINFWEFSNLHIYSSLHIYLIKKIFYLHIDKFWILPLFHESTRLILECYLQVWQIFSPGSFKKSMNFLPCNFIPSYKSNKFCKFYSLNMYSSPHI